MRHRHPGVALFTMGSFERDAFHECRHARERNALLQLDASGVHIESTSTAGKSAEVAPDGRFSSAPTFFPRRLWFLSLEPAFPRRFEVRSLTSLQRLMETGKRLLGHACYNWVCKLSNAWVGGYSPACCKDFWRHRSRIVGGPRHAERLGPSKTSRSN